MVLWPTTINSIFERCLRNVQPFRQFGERNPFPREGDDCGIALVILLNLARGPAAICLAIGAIVIAAVQRCPCGPLAHVGKELRE